MSWSSPFDPPFDHLTCCFLARTATIAFSWLQYAYWLAGPSCGCAVGIDRQDEVCHLIPGCCEEDCCSPNTSWKSLLCTLCAGCTRVGSSVAMSSDGSYSHLEIRDLSAARLSLATESPRRKLRIAIGTTNMFRIHSCSLAIKGQWERDQNTYRYRLRLQELSLTTDKLFQE